MDRVDGSDHYSKTSDEPPASLLTIILDTNPNAWALLEPTLPISAAIANILVFINAHIAINNANKVAIIASHTQRAEFLYPPILGETSRKASRNSTNGKEYNDSRMADESDEDDSGTLSSNMNANHYRPFYQIETALIRALSSLYDTTSPSSLTPTTSIAGALTLALTYISKQQLLDSSDLANDTPNATNSTGLDPQSNTQSALLLPRILILSVSGDLAHQYIPIMNTIFACQRLSIPIDICKISGDTVFLQQASDATHGTYIKLEHPRGLLQYLMLAFLPDQSSRRSLIQASAVGVDFRAACFCHRKVVDTGWVCSICLSIFCAPPEGAICLTCGTHLKLGNYGSKPALSQKKKKRQKDKSK